VTDKDLFLRFGQTFVAGEVLFSEGERGDQMYVIQSGAVQLTRKVRGREVHLATLPAGEFFGEMAIVNNQPRSATATVTEEARLLVIDKRTFEAMVRGNAEIALRFIKKLAARLAHANSQVEVLLLQDLNHRVVKHLRQTAEMSGVIDGPGMQMNITVDDIATAVGAKVKDVEKCLHGLEQAWLITRDDTTVHIAEVGKLEQFLEFLEMKESFGA
jgi:CRP/FNR family transcriptional regulator, cyclic AMP receptor protein